MPGPAPKDPSTRARRNKSSTRATLSEPPKGAKVPAMPDPPLLVEYDEDKLRHTHEVPWHDMAVRWWNDVWSAPMSTEWHESDIHNLYICLLLQQDMWTASTPKDRSAAQAEYRLQRKDLGLTPLDRRRLEWSIETAEDAKDKGRSRRERQAVAEKPKGKGKAGDPRELFAVK
jgi:hypothetical protein